MSPAGVVLDMDSTEILVYGEYEQSAHSSHSLAASVSTARVIF